MKTFFLVLTGLLAAFALGLGAYLIESNDSTGGLFLFLGAAQAVFSWRSLGK